MNEKEFEEFVGDRLFEEVTDGVVTDVNDFGASALITRNRGLVVRLRDGSEFQLTIVKSRSETPRILEELDRLGAKNEDAHLEAQYEERFEDGLS